MRAIPLLLTALLLAGCLDTPAEPAPPAENIRTDEADLRAITARFDGRATGTPAAPQTADHFFDVPTGAVGVNATLAWEAPVARFRFVLIDPNEEVVATGYPERAGHLVVATVDPPKSGTWTLRVIADAAVDIPYTVDAAAELIVPKDNVVRQTTELGARRYNEVNVIMEAGATFNFTFQASAEIEWDVHSHPGREVKYWQQGTGTSAASNFTAPERGIYSLLFYNPNALPVDLTFEMTGEFRLHSHAQ